MPRYKPVGPEETGSEMATVLVSFHAELLRQGIDKEIAVRLAERVAGAASSNSDGHCGDLMRLPWEGVINPPYAQPPRR